MPTEAQSPRLIEEPIELEHPVLPWPGEHYAAAVVAEHGVPKLAEVIRQRNAAIRAERESPLTHGFECATWVLADVLLGFIGYDVFVMRIRAIAQTARLWRPEVVPDLLDWCEDAKLREAIKAGPYQLGCLLGGNSAAKSEYIMKRGTDHAVKFKDARIWLFHESEISSIDLHQDKVWKYLPQSWKEAGKLGRPAYVGYKSQIGFSDNRVTGPNGSMITFKNYGQDPDKAIEGGEVGDPLLRKCIGWAADELLPINWLETLRFRLNRRQATGIVGFTPKYGYSDVVGWFRDGATLVRAEMGTALLEPKPIPLVELGAPDGDGVVRKVIIHFHTRYNPYPNAGSYPNLVAGVQGDSDQTRAIRLYGYTESKSVQLFPRLSRKVHSFAGQSGVTNELKGVG